MYADENDRELPWSGGNNNAECLVALVVVDIPTYKLFICPSDSGNNLVNRSADDGSSSRPLNGMLGHPDGIRQSYDYLGAYTAEPLRMPAPWESMQKVAVMWDNGGTDYAELNHVPGGSNVLWLDGSAEFRRADFFATPYLPFRPPGIAMREPLAARRFDSEGNLID